MTIDEMKNSCIAQLLYGRTFLSIYAKELHALICDPQFMSTIWKINSTAPFDVEFPKDMNNPTHIAFKKETLYNYFVSDELFSRFPAYARIYTSVRSKNSTGLSAIISIYYAVRYIGLSSLTS